MKVKELLDIIHPLCDPEIVIYDTTTDRESTYNTIVDGCDYKKEVFWDFGERTVLSRSVVVGEHNDETPFLHFAVE